MLGQGKGPWQNRVPKPLPMVPLALSRERWGGGSGDASASTVWAAVAEAGGDLARGALWGVLQEHHHISRCCPILQFRAHCSA